MNKQTIFISHASADAGIVKPFASGVEALSLGQLKSWFSSSDAISQGIEPGETWFEKIVSMIRECDSMIVFLTPNSVNNKWVHFEVGMAYGLQKKIFPVCFGIGISDVKEPIRQMQLCQIGDYDSTRRMFTQLFETFGLFLAENVGHEQIRDLIEECNDALHYEDVNRQSSFNKIVSDVCSHIDKRLVEFAQIGINPDFTDRIRYSVNFDIKMCRRAEHQYLEIKSADSVQDVLNRIYFLIEKNVTPYSYLQKWIIREKQSRSAVVIYEVADMIPASTIFIPNLVWIVERLTKPYDASKAKIYNGRGINHLK